MKKLLLIGFSILCLSYLSGCGSGSGSGDVTQPSYTANFERFVKYAVTVVPARTDTPYKAVLAECVYSRSWSEPCNLSKLPLLGQDYKEPTIEQVMERVIVSHSWMADNFRVLLNTLPEDILDLFKSVTAIVIASDIRPSGYWGITGAIYLDPAYLWMTYEEKVTIDREEDYRSQFGNDLKYITLGRYVKHDEYVYYGFDWDSSEERVLTDIKYKMASILFHELCHANDYLPHYNTNGLSPEQTIFEAVVTHYENRLSRMVTLEYPLTSGMLFGLARVKFWGDAPGGEQLRVGPEDVAAAFADDLASSDYSYVSELEDMAMIFEDIMMKYHFGVDRDFAITGIPENDAPVANDFKVVWGTRNRIGSINMKEKSKLVADYMFPDHDFLSFFNNLSGSEEMVAGSGWIDNLSLKTGKASKLQLEKSIQEHKSIEKYLLRILPPE